ncbi:tRNA 2'-phosphotransferase KNAG_0K00640 [Huiozyma naganishii CBS 8797]|uniref:2'-phosphotransferase n=1 Tax=Huiozyma naganishii (strain ATCC MYA-139 / BCRC 22969 / CBS 8797 / KCTC 17520 / NBRC 10181 / NCYC 3082 / Yp74L-3) TaxID=1071383 RepID=J7S358_HUIN7|nr:hypothetical protein KNAG_0K00640 [Kazachstania naganishii CBS 8797]CCK72432.1 hypothetical protein KNAG_0K00640 [Kazachstania naganishii CBS 8797]
MTDARRDVQISKALSYLLRHGAAKEKLPMDANGYVPVSAVLTHQRLKSHRCSHDDLVRVVECNEKQRFHLRNVAGVEEIAATQGHSLRLAPDESVLQRVTAPLDHPLIHGTNMGSLQLILQSGAVKRMRRNHIHLSRGVVGQDTAVVSGMRKNCQVLIYLKVSELVGRMPVYRSLNDVYLTAEDIPLDLFEKVVFRGVDQLDLFDVTTQLDQLNIPYEF